MYKLIFYKITDLKRVYLYYKYLTDLEFGEKNI